MFLSMEIFVRDRLIERLLELLDAIGLRSGVLILTGLQGPQHQKYYIDDIWAYGWDSEPKIASPVD